MTGATVWLGRRGPVMLGPTQDRVARHLVKLTRHGRVTIRTQRVVHDLRIERSEVYRITARLRLLGLFGIEDDRGGTKGGRRWWRTAIPHDGAHLPADRHRVAWRRLAGWLRARGIRRVQAYASAVGAGRYPVDDGARQRAERDADPPAPPPGDFERRMRAHGMGKLLDEWARQPMSLDCPHCGGRADRYLAGWRCTACHRILR